MQNVTNLFIANLAFSDVIIAVFCIPFQVGTIKELLRIVDIKTYTLDDYRDSSKLLQQLPTNLKELNFWGVIALG